MSCLSAKPTQNLNKPCTPPVVGVRSTFYAGLLSQIQSITRASGDDKTITAIVLKTGEKLTKIEGFGTANNFFTEFNATEYANYTPHVGTFPVFDQSSTGLKQVDILKDAEGLFIITKQNGISGAWRVLGINAGMKCTNVAMSFNDANGGASVMTFRADNEIVQPEILKHVTSSLDDTDSYLAGLAFTDPS